MFENMVGPVGLAMHADRLAQATKNMRLAEAQQERRTPKGTRHRGYRAEIAAALVSLAARVAPAATLSGGAPG